MGYLSKGVCSKGAREACALWFLSTHQELAYLATGTGDGAQVETCQGTAAWQVQTLNRC